MRKDRMITSLELSPREKQILDLFNEGKSQKFIAYELGIDISTVSTITCRIKQKAKGRGYKRMIVFINDDGEIWRG